MMKCSSVPRLLTLGFLSAEFYLYLSFLRLDLLDQNSTSTPLKYTGTLLCLAFSVLCALLGGDRLVPFALLLTCAADWFLLIQNDHLPLGVTLFLCVQGLYFLRLHRAGGSLRLLWLRLALAVVLTAAPLLIPGMATPLNLLAMLYFSQLLSNTVLAWILPPLRQFALGLTLFVGCDVCVGLFNAFSLPPALFAAVAVGMWFFYLPSQVLIALSARPTKEVPNENK